MLDKKHKARTIFIDLRNAYDSVEHNILVSKLELYGIKVLILMWFLHIYKRENNL